MKALLILICLLVSTMAYSQVVNLTSDHSVREFLNEKEIKVGEYGTILFIYDKFEREFGSMDFKVQYQLKDRVIPLKANIIIDLNEFSFPTYVRSITLSDPNSYTSLKINAPINFMIFENGELYYQDKTIISMDEYLNSIVTGKPLISSPGFKRCN